MQANKSKTQNVMVRVPKDVFKAAQEKRKKAGHSWQWIFLEFLKDYVGK